ncbi:MAG: HlyD family efflux transporter periplasmic adaptor subunit, partial [Planctomycetota bacterium]
SAGWIEPRPTAVNVPALAAGVIQELLVVEGQLVADDEPIAKLIATDAELAVQQAQAAIAIREGELQRALAEQAAADMRLGNPAHLKAEVASARSTLAKTTTELERLPFLAKAATANVAFTRSSWESKKAAGPAIARLILEQAANEHTAAVAELEELDRRKENLKREKEALGEKLSALEDRLTLLVEERRQVGEARAKVATAAAQRDEARLSLRRAELDLERTIVRAPIQGRILRLVAFPGTRVMGLMHTAAQSSSTVVEMYDPKRLQVRADVRLEDVPQVRRGAPVEIETASSGTVLRGRVLRATSSANVQKNTLEVKVELIEPPDTVAPEMLVTATFLAPEETQTQSERTETNHTLVPAQLIVPGETGTSIWIIDEDDRAVLRPILTGGDASKGLTVVIEGLDATDKLIVAGREGLAEGDAVKVTGEDQTIGVGR